MSYIVEQALHEVRNSELDSVPAHRKLAYKDRVRDMLFEAIWLSLRKRIKYTEERGEESTVFCATLSAPTEPFIPDFIKRDPSKDEGDSAD